MLAAAAAVALACAAAAQAAEIGANDDTGKFAADGGADFFQRMSALGLRQTVLTVRFRPSDPLAIQDRAFLDRAVPEATRAGLDVVFAVYPYPPRELEASYASFHAFAQHVALLAQTYPAVKSFVIGNEPNQPAFLRPQFGANRRIVSAAVAGSYLAVAYDALKAVDPTIRVIGVGLSPRGNDNPTASSNVSTSPVRFLAALGRWYRSTGRTIPIMDAFSFHPYPNFATDSLDRGYPWPNAGFANVARIKQALWDAFDGTGQPTTVTGLKLHLDEVGWQVDTSYLAGYTGFENVRVTDEATQAYVYGQLIRRAACDPDIAEVNLFGFHDDPAREGFQSALHRADGSPRPAVDAVRGAIADTAAGCFAPQRQWRPTKSVVGAAAPVVRSLPKTLRVEASAQEGAVATACLVSATLTRSQAIRRLQQLSGKRGCVKGTALPGRPARLVLARPARGTMQVAVRLVAETNPTRRSDFTRSVR